MYMTLILSLMAALAVLELLLWLPAVWANRTAPAVVMLIANVALPVSLTLLQPAVWSMALLFLGLYRAVNMLRLVEGRIQKEHLYHASRRTSVALIALQAFVLGAAALIYKLNISPHTWEYVIVGSGLFASLMLLLNFRYRLSSTLPPEPNGTVHQGDLPSVTVAIPARNETTDLELCLKSLIASDYRKLEILVLDDCSQNTRTPEIIRSFAHDGVRFIAGEVPPKRWLAKNYAYKRLTEESNGELLLFCGVDMRFKPDSIKLLVTAMLQEQAKMVSVLPRNGSSDHPVLSSIVQPGRYAWEMLLPRWIFARPPVLSSCWIITRQLLKSSGGFEAFAQSIVPERHFARRATEEAQAYRFLRSSPDMGISTAKRFDEQQATALRTRYPQLRRRPETAALYSLLATLVLLWPYKLLAISLIERRWYVGILAAANILILTYIGFNLVTLTYRRRLWRGLILMPFIAAYDIGMVNYSMWQYEFHEVLWKGRNVCVPVMQVIPQAVFNRHLR